MNNQLNSAPTENKQALIIGVGALALLANVFLSGCTTMAGEGWGAGDRGRILISADAEGMQAFSDMVQGSIVNGKASPDQDTTHYQLRKEQVRAKILPLLSINRPKAQPQAQARPTGAVREQDVELGQAYK